MRLQENLLGTAYNRMMGKKSPRRIAVVGSQASGKTVFLTSLIAHLQNHDPQALSLGKGVEILKCEELRKPLSFSAFPYEFNRSTLVHDSTWPAKTRDISTVRLRLKLKRGRRAPEQIELEFLDFPGERAADFLMFSRSYEEWSDMVSDSIQADRFYSELAYDFNRAAGEFCAENELIRAYKKFLGEALRQRYSRIITPSMFLIDGEGRRPDAAGTPESWCAERFCGLNAAEQFVPLSQAARQSNPASAKKFAKHYRRYCAKVVNPLVNWLLDADQMFILLDIAQILTGGSSMYNDEQAIANQVLEICDRKKSLWQELLQVGVLGWLLMRPSRIEHIGIVATKSDLVATNDDIDNLESLAREMTYKKLRGLGVDSYDFFTCATVVSTELSDRRTLSLRGRLAYNERGERVSESDSHPVEFYPSRVPEHWPEGDDEWGDFSFPEVYPRISARRDTPPPQEGLDRIVKSFLGL